jgi:hypothetical protein
MPTKKSSSRRPEKAAGPKTGKSKERAFPTLEPPYPRPVKMRRSKKISGVKMITLWGASDDIPNNIDWNKVPRMPNPMPDNIVSLLKLAGEASWLTIPLAPYIYLLIKSWFEGRNNRRLKIKNGNVEMEFQGAWSDKKFQQAFDRFRKMTKELNEDDIQVIENGRVIEDRKAPAYKVEQSDIERAREMQSGAAKAKITKKSMTKNKRK